MTELKLELVRDICGVNMNSSSVFASLFQASLRRSKSSVTQIEYFFDENWPFLPFFPKYNFASNSAGITQPV